MNRGLNDQIDMNATIDDDHIASMLSNTQVEPLPGSSEPIYQKVHTSTVCMVPPESAVFAWEQLSKARLQLRDPGFYRWPPHANLLYPFVNLSTKTVVSGKDEINGAKLRLEYCLEKLGEAASQCSPFNVTLDTLGTFGGKKRGVLWMYPKSFREDSLSTANEPLIELQGYLQEVFPYCNDQQKIAGVYNPHITLTHCANVDDAEELKKDIENWWKPITFPCSEIYLLERSGDSGQFKILAIIKLGGKSVEDRFKLFNPPKPFNHMPVKEDEWVYDERMKLKKRRNNRR